MSFQYTITKNTLNQIQMFTKLYERLHLIKAGHPWLKRLLELSIDRSALGAVLTDKTEFAKIDFLESGLDINRFIGNNVRLDFENYRSTLRLVPQLFDSSRGYSLDMLEDIHSNLIGKSTSREKYHYRESERMLEKVVIENNIRKTVEFKVQSKPQEIMEKMREFSNWMLINSESENVLLFCAIAHLKLLAIHPYADANGRLARILDNIILYRSGFLLYPLVSLEDYYLEHFERYYSLIDQSIRSKDLTEWIEFYTNGLLESISYTHDILKRISAGSIDLFKPAVLELTEKELEVLEIIASEGQSSGAEIGKKLSVTRQSINNIMQRLKEKGIVETIGNASSTRYRVKKL